MDDCILWNKAINSSGYGVVFKGGKQHYATVLQQVQKKVMS